MNTISPLTPADLPRALQIEQASHAFAWSEATFLSNQGDRYLNLKIVSDNQIVGFAISQIVLDEATLFNLAILPDFQRRGLGRRLLQVLLDQLSARGMQTVWLEVRASNNRAIALYEQFGFNEVSVRRDYYPAANGREDAIIMALPLG
jgi:ribosomal-protein-alanine N-acetyltransferase